MGKKAMCCRVEGITSDTVNMRTKEIVQDQCLYAGNHMENTERQQKVAGKYMRSLYKSPARGEVITRHSPLTRTDESFICKYHQV